MAEVKLRNGVYVSKEDRAVSMVQGNYFKAAKMGPEEDGGVRWTDIRLMNHCEVDNFRWTKDTLVLPEEYLT